MALSLYRGFVFHITLKLNNDKRNNIHCGTMNVKPELYLNLSIFFLNFIILPEREHFLIKRKGGREKRVRVSGERREYMCYSRASSELLGSSRRQGDSGMWR